MPLLKIWGRSPSHLSFYFFSKHFFENLPSAGSCDGPGAPERKASPLFGVEKTIKEWKVSQQKAVTTLGPSRRGLTWNRIGAEVGCRQGSLSQSCKASSSWPVQRKYILFWKNVSILFVKFLAVLGLCCFAQAFSSCDVQASHCSASLVDHRL